MGIPAACTLRCRNQSNEGKMFGLPENHRWPEARLAMQALLMGLIVLLQG
jgi:hypothetical protein